MKISLVTTAYNEECNIAVLCDKVKRAFKGFDYEFIAVDDGSIDDTCKKLIREKNAKMRVISLKGHKGKDAALYAGIKECKGEIIATIDADLQDDPKDAVNLVNKIGKDCDFACGWRGERKDTTVKRLSSWIANRIFNLAFGMKLHDTNCPVKAFKRECVSKVRLFKNYNRFLTIMAFLQGFKVKEFKVKNYPRASGVSKYGINRFITTFRSMIKVRFWYKDLLA